MMNLTSKKNRSLAVFIVIAVAALLRLYNINGSMFDFNPLRQAVNGFITCNLAFNPHAQFLIPQIDNMGPSPAYFMCELPILQYLTAQLVKLFGVQNWVFRFPQVIFFIFSAFYFYRIALKLTEYRIALVSLIFYSLAPMSILMSRVFQIDSLMILSLLFSVYYLIDWIEKEGVVPLLLSNLGLLSFTLLKLPNFYILIFFYSLFIIYRKPRLIYRYSLSLLFVIAVNFWWWFIFSSPVRNKYPNEYTFAQGASIFSIKHTLYIISQFIFSPDYWVMTFKQTFIQVLSPFLFILSLIGLLKKGEKRSSAIFLSWVISVLVFLTFVPGAGGQDYYKLHLVPPAALFASIAYFWCFGNIRSVRLKLFSVVVFWVVTVASVFAITYPMIRYKPIFARQEIIGKHLQSLLKKNDLVIASFGPDAMLLFYCNRRGWNQYLLSGDDNSRLLEERRKQGAFLFVSGNLDEFENNKSFRDYMIKHYRLIETSPREFAVPKKYTLDYFIWLALGRKKKLERVSLGHVVFDLRMKH